MTWSGSADLLRQTRRQVNMSKRENETNNALRSSDRPLTEYESEQKALRENLARLKADRLAREKAKTDDA